jgi:hypothetical protein
MVSLAENSSKKRDPWGKWKSRPHLWRAARQLTGHTPKQVSRPSYNLGKLLRGVLHLLVRHFGEERHAQSSPAGTLGMRETAGSKSERSEGGLQRHGTRIVDGGVDSARLQGRAHGITPLNVNHEQVVHPFISRIIQRNFHVGALQHTAVERGDFHSARVPLFQALQLDP